MKASEYIKYDGLGLAELARDGQVSPAELAQCATQLVEQHNPAINAVLELFADTDDIAASAPRNAAFG